jgi:hypothetical protein
MMKYAVAAYGFATSGGTLAYQSQAPSAEKADHMIDERLAAPITADANDFIYQWEASRDYDASVGLPRIEAKLLAINSADDERNPPETGVTAAAIKEAASISSRPRPRRAATARRRAQSSTSFSLRNCCARRPHARCDEARNGAIGQSASEV